MRHVRAYLVFKENGRRHSGLINAMPKTHLWLIKRLNTTPWPCSLDRLNRAHSVLILNNEEMTCSLQQVYTAFLIKTLHLPNILQGKGYMKTYWLKGKKDLSFKTPAELRYSSEQKDSEDKSSNGWVDKRRAVSTKESLFFLTHSGLRMLPVDSVRAVLIAPCSKGCFRCFCFFEGVMLTTKNKIFTQMGQCTLGLLKHYKKQNRVRQNRQHRTTKTSYDCRTY